MLKNIFLLLSLSISSYSQDYANDTLIVRAILDTNELYDIPVDSVTDSINGRINKLILIGGGTWQNIPKKINIITPEIENLDSLFQFHLPYNNIISIPPEIGNLTKLARINLFINKLTTIPPEIGNLNSLKELILGTNYLDSLPKTIGNLSNLELLTLDSNNLTILIPEIKGLTNLTHLSLYSNYLTELPFEIGVLTNLILLNVALNNLKTIPSEIGKLANLEMLSFAYNYITTVPPEIGNLSNLTWLALLYNNLTTLPDSIIKLVPNEYFSISYNNLDTINLSDTVIAWLDKYNVDPDWRDNQTPIIYTSKLNPTSQQYLILPNLKNSKVNYYISLPGKITLELLDLKGRMISTLIDSYKQKGNHSVNLNSKYYSSGVYYFRLTTGGNLIVKKAVLIK